MKRFTLLFAMLNYFFLAFAQNYSYDLLFQKIDLTVDPAVRYITGQVEFVINLSEPATTVSFDLSDSLTVDSITGEGSTLNFTHSNNRINVDFGQSVSGLRSFTVFYHGEPSSSGFESFSVASHNDVPVMWTLSEPYGAEDWLPTKNGLTDKIDSIEMILRVPEEYTAASNGLLILDTVIDGKHVLHWKSRYPIAPYLVAFAVTNYSVYYDTAMIGDTFALPVMNFVYPEDSAYARSRTPYAAECLEFFSEKFIPYPFYKEKYGHAQFQWGGGMEHQTMTFVSGFGQMLLSHELAHQWFGDYITCGSWHEIYLNEAFATYLEGLTAEEGLADYTFDQWLDGARYYAFNYEGSIYVDDTTDVGRIFSYALSYMKGALFLHTLRWFVGDSAFFAGLKGYLTDSSLAYGFAHTRDLQRHLEQACNCDLSGVFGTFLYANLYPKYNIVVKQEDSQHYAVKVTQQNEPGDPEFFRMKVPLFFSGQNQGQLVVLDNTHNNQIFEIELPFVVEDISFDPERKILAQGTVTLVTEADELLGDQPVAIFPTLSNGTLKIALSSTFKIRGFAKIVNLNGQTVFSLNLDSLQPGRINTININSLPSGTYLFVVYDTEGNTTVYKQKFVKL